MTNEWRIDLIAQGVILFTFRGFFTVAMGFQSLKNCGSNKTYWVPNALKTEMYHTNISRSRKRVDGSLIRN